MTTTALTTVPRRSPRPNRDVVRSLGALEARRMLTHPLVPVGVVLSVAWGYASGSADWSGARYVGYLSGVTPLLLVVSVICAAAAVRDAAPAFEDVPTTAGQRAAGRLLGSAALVSVVAAFTALAATYLRLTGGVDLGDEPGRTLHAHYSLPELLQPVALSVLAVSLGMAAGRLLKNRIICGIVLFVVWFVVGAVYWAFNGPSTMALAIVQTQPITVQAGPASADPLSFPADWLLTAPGPYQDFWGRLVLSPELAAWHDVYVLGLAVALLGTAVPGSWRRPLVVAGLAVAVLAVVVQRAVQP